MWHPGFQCEITIAEWFSILRGPNTYCLAFFATENHKRPHQRCHIIVRPVRILTKATQDKTTRDETKLLILALNAESVAVDTESKTLTLNRSTTIRTAWEFYSYHIAVNLGPTSKNQMRSRRGHVVSLLVLRTRRKSLCIRDWGVERTVDADEHGASTEDHPNGGGIGTKPRSHADKLNVTPIGRRVSRERRENGYQ